LLESENDKNVAIACYDLGEFCRYHPFGKKFNLYFSLLEKFDGKKIITLKARDKN
jgi:V-type H+-transporting ATPase subunit H